jgi:hypothetical protein
MNLSDRVAPHFPTLNTHAARQSDA